MTRQDVESILLELTYPGYQFFAVEGSRIYIQAQFLDRCSITGREELQYTRKWYVSRDACKNEVVQTALKCVLTSVEHEARERFKYRGKAIYGPHFDVDALHRICSDKELDYRSKTA